MIDNLFYRIIMHNIDKQEEQVLDDPESFGEPIH